MDKKEYILRQFSRTNHKSYENYCITRIFHKLNDFEVQFITQQMFTRTGEDIALADLYLPQLNIIVEVDEAHHKNQTQEDKQREQDIINNKIKALEEVIPFKRKIYRIDATESIEKINQRIDEIVSEIKNAKVAMGIKFPKWEVNYHEPEYYINKGEISTEEKASFKTIQHVANLFNRYSEKKRVYNEDGKYIGTQQSFLDEEGSNILVWLPKLTINKGDYKGNPYLNTISEDGKIVNETPKNTESKAAFLNDHINGKKKEFTTRYLFAKYKDSNGEDRYRFRGIFELNKEESIKNGVRVWERKGCKVSLEKYHKKEQPINITI